MLGKKLRRLGILAVPPAALSLMAASAAKAYNNVYTFDTAASVETNPGGDYGINPNGPPPAYLNSRFDYGSGGPASTNSTGWAAAPDHTGNGGGSLMQSITFKNSPTAQNGAFTVDMYWSAQVATNLSFYIMLAPGSAYSTQAGSPGASSGYFQVAVRDGSYGFNNTGPGYPGGVGDPTVNGVLQNGNGWNFGDPNYTGSSDQGTWEYVTIPLAATYNASGGPDNQVRALTFQDYDDDSSTGRKIAGTVTWYIDDLTLTPVPVPEPACLGLLGLAVPALLARRRKHA
ncbi:MAG: PEP-CTERM sorting domain-containing protein [Tepidisphaeraceae bacterium]